MSLKENFTTYKSLPLKLNHGWSPHLPTPLWRGYSLSAEGGLNLNFLDLSHLSLAEALKAVSTPLEYVEFLGLCAFLEEDPQTAAEIPALEKSFYYRWNDEARELFLRWNSKPGNFKTWCKEKKLKFSDLRPLLRLQNDSMNPFLEKISGLHCSKQTGSEILELLCDFDETKTHELEGLLSSNDFTLWSAALQKLSHPLTYEKDRARTEKVRAWPWPTKVKGEWKRIGDQAGLKIELYSTNPQEFENKINELKKICERWKEGL